MVHAFIRDSFWGRIVYHLSSHKYFSHKEEHPDYVVPEKYLLDSKQNFSVELETSMESSSSSESSIASAETKTTTNIMVTWDSDDDPENPKNWSKWYKVLLTLQICFLTVSVYMASAIYTPGIDSLMVDLGISRVLATLPLTMFVIGYAIGPLFWSPLSENAIFGRTNIYIFTVFVFFILQIPISLVNDIASLSVLRLIAGFFASPCLGTGGASMGDIISIPYLPLAIATWSIAAVCGPSMGPLIGSILVVKRNWHWTFWFVCMISGISTLVLSLFLPETYEKTLLLRKAKRLRKVTGNDRIISEGELENEGLVISDIVTQAVWRPIEIIMFEPIVLAIDVYIALVYTILYLWFEAFPIVFIETHHFSLIPFGTTYVSVMVGILIGAGLYIYYLNKTFTKKILAGEMLDPEFFIPIMLFGAVFMPIGIFIFGWTSAADLHWIGPLIGSALFALGGFFVFQTGFNYLASSFPKYLASVFAGNQFLRSTLAGCFPLFGHSLFSNLKTERFPVAWGSTILGCLSLLMILIPVTFYVKGHKLRASSKYSGF